MLLDHGGDNTHFSPNQLDCGMGTFTLLDGHAPRIDLQLFEQFFHRQRLVELERIPVERDAQGRDFEDCTLVAYAQTYLDGTCDL